MSEGRKRTAIDAPRGTYFWLDPDDPRLKIVGLDIRTGQTKPDGPEHYLYDTRAFREIQPERVANYRHYGIRKPAVVVVDGEDLLVDDGRGRIKGARLVKALQVQAGETETIRVPVIIAKGDESHLFGLGRALNLHDAPTAMENARDAQRFLDMGRTMQEVAVTFGVSEQTVRNWQTLLNDIAPEVVAEVLAGNVTPTAAIQLAHVPKAEQAEVLATVKAEAKGKRVTVEKVAEKAKERAGKPTGTTPKAKLEKIGQLMFKLSGAAAGERTKDHLMEVIDKVCRLATGHSLEKLGDVGD